MVSFSDNNSDLGNAGYLGFELPGESAIERAIDRFETGKINFGVLNASGQDVLVDRIFEVDRLMDEDAHGRYIPYPEKILVSGDEFSLPAYKVGNIASTLIHETLHALEETKIARNETWQNLDDAGWAEDEIGSLFSGVVGQEYNLFVRTVLEEAVVRNSVAMIDEATTGFNRSGNRGFTDFGAIVKFYSSLFAEKRGVEIPIEIQETLEGYFSDDLLVLPVITVDGVKITRGPNGQVQVISPEGGVFEEVAAPSFWQEIKSATTEFIEDVKELGRDVGNALKQGVQAVGNLISTAANAVGDFFNDVVDFFKGDKDDDEGSSSDEDNGKPIILDLDGDGVEINVKGDVSFDMDNDGWFERTAWADADDGFLVMDLGQQGVIDQTDELILSNNVEWEGATDLQALATYDQWASRGGNNDGKLSKIINGDPTTGDEVWTSLKVWQDKNQDGKSSADELFTLDDLGITEIGLSYDDGTDFFDVDNDVEVFGSKLLGSSTYKHDGSVLTAGEVVGVQHVVAGGVGDVSLRYGDHGWKRDDSPSYGYDILTEDGERYRYKVIDDGDSATFTTSSSSYNGVHGDSRNNKIDYNGSNAVILDGGAGNDWVAGQNNDDQVFGGAGHDYVDGDGGDDFVYGGAGNDTVYGREGNDSLFGGAGTDRMYGGSGNDILDFGGNTGSGFEYAYGGAGNDTYLVRQGHGNIAVVGETATGGYDRIVFADLDFDDVTVRRHGAARPDSLVIQDGNGVNLHIHGAGNFTENGIESFEFADGSVVNNFRLGASTHGHLYGTAGNDVYDLGGNSDSRFEHAYGGAGDDIYMVRQGQGKIAVVGETASGGHDRIVFADLDFDDVTVKRHGPARPDSLVIQDGNGVNLHIHGAGNFTENGIERFEFADGTVVNDFRLGASTYGHLYGTAGNDVFDLGGNSDSRFEHAYGGAGDDIYIMNQGDGRVAIKGETLADVDTVYFADHVLSDLRVSKHSNTVEFPGSLVIEDGNGFLLHIDGAGDLTEHGIERFVFADGKVVDELVMGESANQILEGTVGNDVIDFGGNTSSDVEYAYGSAGDDTYIINQGDGRVAIKGETSADVDTVYFADHVLSDLRVSKHSNTVDFPGSLVIEDGNGFHLHIHGAGDFTEHGIEQFVFADGTVLGSIKADDISGTRDRFYGTVADDIIQTGTANTHNYIYGESGNDTLLGGDGWDYLVGGAGDDFLDAGGNMQGGWQYTIGQGGNDTYNYRMGGGSVSVSGETATTGDADSLVFSDLNLSDFTFSTHDYGDTANGVALRMLWSKDGQSGEVRITHMGEHIEEFVFADGTVLGSINADAISGTRDRLYGTVADDFIQTGTANTHNYIYGKSGNDTLLGGDGWDYLVGGAGDDSLDAGGNMQGGWQYTIGQSGNDTYNYRMGGGSVSVSGETATTGDTDSLVFSDLNLSDFTFSTHDYGDTANGVALRMLWSKDGQSGEVRITHMGEHIEEFVFADATTYTWDEFAIA